jgi:hypothetical protein
MMMGAITDCIIEYSDTKEKDEQGQKVAKYKYRATFRIAASTRSGRPAKPEVSEPPCNDL